MNRRRLIATAAATVALSTVVPIFAQTTDQYYSRIWLYPFCGYDGAPVRAGLLAETSMPITPGEALIAQSEFNNRETAFRTLFEQLYRQQKTAQGMDQARADFQKLLDEIAAGISQRAGRRIGIEVSPLPFVPEPNLKCTLS